MLEKIFNYDNPVFRIIVKFGKLWVLNMLWILCSIPIFTIGAATTALIYSCMKLKDEDGNIIKNFFHSFKHNFLQANIIGILYMLIGTILAFDIIYWNHADRTGVKIFWAISIAFILIYFISLIYVFAVLARFVNSIKNTIIYSFLVAIYNIKYTIIILFTVGIFIYINVSGYFIFNFLSINFGIGILVYILSIFYDKVFQKFYKNKENKNT